MFEEMKKDVAMEGFGVEMEELMGMCMGWMTRYMEMQKEREDIVKKVEELRAKMGGVADGE